MFPNVFWCSVSNLRPLFNLRWSWRSWPPTINDQCRSKYEINENKSCEVSNHRFFGVPIQFWDPFLNSDDPGGRDLQIIMTSEGQNMKSKKISYVRYQNIGFLVFRTYWLNRRRMGWIRLRVEEWYDWVKIGGYFMMYFSDKNKTDWA